MIGTAREARTFGKSSLHFGDALACYEGWQTPTVIVSDGPYGVAGYPGDPPTHAGLADAYAPHVEAWSRFAAPSTTLWFWCTEVGWATVHPVLERNGWEYRSLHVWDKGVAHAAGNSNTKTLRKYPVVTEVCGQYVRQVRLVARGAGRGRSSGGKTLGPGPGLARTTTLPLKEWLRHEWERSGLPLSLANEACGVKNAATRKYFTQCHLWYFPPADAFERFAAYVNEHGAPEGRPYFSTDGKRPLTAAAWSELRAKFHCDVGVTNVWSEPAVRGSERLKEDGSRVLHTNQKPLKLMERIICASSDPGDVVWEPFGGLCTATVAALRARRIGCAAELQRPFYELALRRIEAEHLHAEPAGVYPFAAIASRTASA